jgi:hemin uptake protein HemP
MRIIIIHIREKMNMIKEVESQHGARVFDKPREICESGMSRQVNSAVLLGSRDALAIQHRGECYILRQTRAGKLILTK